MSNSRLCLLLLVSILSLLIITSSTNLVTAQRCRPDQTETLKRFKNEFAFSRSCTDDAYFLGGVTCDNVTGAVTVLELPGGCLRGTLRDNSSLFELSHLRYLNLSFNNFASSPLPSAFGQLNNLEVLLLSSNGFLGQVPSSIRNLTKLTQLQLANNKLTGDLTSLLQNRTNLGTVMQGFIAPNRVIRYPSNVNRGGTSNIYYTLMRVSLSSSVREVKDSVIQGPIRTEEDLKRDYSVLILRNFSSLETLSTLSRLRQEDMIHAAVLGFVSALRQSRLISLKDEQPKNIGNSLISFNQSHYGVRCVPSWSNPTSKRCSFKCFPS
ncbi:Receptor like protein 22 [Hirschfeldia incana]|nr:Receptor like protein 22 [Hirschfeldia incana]